MITVHCWDENIKGFDHCDSCHWEWEDGYGETHETELGPYLLIGCCGFAEWYAPQIGFKVCPTCNGHWLLQPHKYCKQCGEVGFVRTNDKR